MTQFDFERARFNMVEQQVRPWEVLNDRVLDVLRTLPRERFVPAAHAHIAYSDLPIPLPHGQSMLEPKLVGRALQALDPKPSEQALEIGTGTGYVTACLAKLAAHVTSVDYFADFKSTAEAHLAGLGIRNVTLATGDAALGWNDGNRYDVIFVTASLPEPHKGFHQSLTLGGRLFLVVGEGPAMEAQLITRVDEDQWAVESLLDTRIPALINAPVTKTFAL